MKDGNLNKNLTVMAYLRAKADKQEILKAALIKQLLLIQQETGNLVMQLHQVQDDPQSFLLYEIWQSKEALAEHFELAPTKNLVKMLDEWLEIPLQVWHANEVEVSG